jgi:hypothetical protein
MSRDRPPNNPLELPFLMLCAVLGIIVAVIGFSDGAVFPRTFGCAGALGAGWLARIVQQSGDPRWLQSPLDRRRRRD